MVKLRVPTTLHCQKGLREYRSTVLVDIYFFFLVGPAMSEFDKETLNSKRGV